MCASNSRCPIPLWGRGGDITITLQPNPRDITEYPNEHHQMCPSPPWGRHLIFFSTKVISPPRPHRGVGHLQFETHITTCVKHNMQLDQPKVIAQLWRLTLASTDHYSKVERLFSNFKGVPLTHWGLECRARLVLGQGLIAVTRSKWTNRSGNIEVFLI